MTAILSIRGKKIEYNETQEYLVVDIETREGEDREPLPTKPRELEKLVVYYDKYSPNEKDKFEHFLISDIKEIYWTLLENHFVLPDISINPQSVGYTEGIKRLTEGRKIKPYRTRGYIEVPLTKGEIKALLNTAELYDRILTTLGYKDNEDWSWKRAQESKKIYHDPRMRRNCRRRLRRREKI